MDLSFIALDLLDHGYSIIPILRQQKKSVVKWKEYQSRKATVEEAERWFTGTDYNIAIVCGAISSCAIVDADNKEAELYCKLHLPPTPLRVRTRKGVHYFYRHPGGRVSSKARILGENQPPIDIRADGGIAVTIGSVHETGFVYHLDDGCDLMAARELPVYDRLWFPVIDTPPIIQSVQVGGDAMKRADGYLNKIEGVGHGLRNDTAFRVSAILTHDFGLGDQEAFTLLSMWNAKNDPPLSERELSTIVESSRKSGRNPFGAKL